MRVVVLKGGKSREREVSLRSGAAVAKALRAKGHEVTEIDPQGENLVARLSSPRPEAVFIALHGHYGEDGCLQGLLEWLEIPYTGSSPFSSALCFDKLASKKWVASDGILTPRCIPLKRSDPLQEWLKKFSLPLPVIVKPNREGSSYGVFRIFKKEELSKKMTEALAFDSTVLVEEYIEGREVTVGVLNGRPLPVVEVVPKGGFYDYESKYTVGKTDYFVPAKLPESVTAALKELGEKICRSLQCEGGVRVDFMLDKSLKPYFLEVNTIPGMTETSLLPKAAACEGSGFEDLCETILSSAGLKTNGGRS